MFGLMDRRTASGSSQPGLEPRNDSEVNRDETNQYYPPCSHCFKIPPEKVEFGRCSRCLSTHYCSPECQMRHWKEHKVICKERQAALVAGKKPSPGLSIPKNASDATITSLGNHGTSSNTAAAPPPNHTKDVPLAEAQVDTSEASIASTSSQTPHIAVSPIPITKALSGVKAYQIDPTKVPPGASVIFNSATPEVPPTILTKDEMKNAIPKEGRLYQPCSRCYKIPPANIEFARCAQCLSTHYCSVECQKKHWKEHKAICKDRKAILMRRRKHEAAALKAGRIYVDPDTLKLWYRMHSAEVEYAAFHALELFRGPSDSLQPTHAAMFNLKLDPEFPNDPSIATLLDVTAVPRKVVMRSEIASKATLAFADKAVKAGNMLLFFCDITEKKRPVFHIELHAPPSPDKYIMGGETANQLWKIHTILGVNVREGVKSPLGS